METKKAYLDSSFLPCVSLMRKVPGLLRSYARYGEASNSMMADVNAVGVGWLT